LAVGLVLISLLAVALATTDFPGEFVSSLTAGAADQALVALSQGQTGRLLAVTDERTVWAASLPYYPVREPAAIPGGGAVVQLRDPDYACAFSGREPAHAAGP
jgi:hypothetical protein